MAEFQGVNNTLRNGTPKEFVDAKDEGARIYCSYDEYTLSADLSSADVIRMMKIPAGARIHEVVIQHPDLDTSGGTLDIGWAASDDGGEAADVDGFFANLDVATAADVVLMSQAAAAPAGMFKEFSEEVEVQITIDGDTDATSGTIKLAIYYSQK